MILDYEKERKSLLKRQYDLTYRKHSVILQKYNVMDHDHRRIFRESQKRLEEARNAYMEAL
jgi:hypothetical protein